MSVAIWATPGAVPIGARTRAARRRLNGSLDFYQPFDFAKGTGSYFAGFQAGYNYTLPSGVVLGVEADVSFPNTIMGTQTFSSPSLGQATYEEQVEYSGTVRGRLGYALGDWLLYATGGYAWTDDQLTRTQVAGHTGRRHGGSGDRGIPASAAQRLGSGRRRRNGRGRKLDRRPRIPVHRLRFAQRNIPGGSTSVRRRSRAAEHPTRSQLSVGRRVLERESTDPRDRPLPTPITGAFTRKRPTSSRTIHCFGLRIWGTNSLIPGQSRETWDATFYVGLRLWPGAELWFNPEIDQGFGLSGTLGVAGFPSGEAYKVGAVYPYARIPRMFIRQTIELGGKREKVDAGCQSVRRLADRPIGLSLRSENSQ